VTKIWAKSGDKSRENFIAFESGYNR